MDQTISELLRLYNHHCLFSKLQDMEAAYLGTQEDNGLRCFMARSFRWKLLASPEAEGTWTLKNIDLLDLASKNQELGEDASSSMQKQQIIVFLRYESWPEVHQQSLLI
jgi:hypothetical protein